MFQQISERPLRSGSLGKEARRQDHGGSDGLVEDEALAEDRHPEALAVIVSCSDSHLADNLVFNQELAGGQVRFLELPRAAAPASH